MSDAAPYDIAIIGGGINGCGIARDAAGRGAKVILFERGDLASGTSSSSTKLIHGGLRYLEHFEFGLVRESLKERERLWAIAPHIIWPMRFILPYRKGLRPRWMLRAGLFLYDHIGGRKRLPATRTIDLTHEPAGKALKPGFATGFEYSDGWVDDARLVVLNTLDAAEHGAEIRTKTEVVSIRRENALWEVALNDGTSINARAVVNAAGPSVLDLLERVKDHQRDPDEAIRLVRGSHIVVPKLFDTPQAWFFQNPDGRIFFAIPYEGDFTLIGTTDADHKSGDPVKASETEIAYLCEAASAYFRKPVMPKDVVWSYAGVRPLVDDGSGKPEAASRGYRFDIDTDADGAAPLLSVFGGKITTYRHLAEGAVGELSRWLPQLAKGSWTANAALPGGDFPIDGCNRIEQELATDFPFLSPTLVARLVRQYGTRARRWLGKAKTWRDLGTGFGHGLTEAEVNYLVETEWAQTADDILWRRTKLGLHFDATQTEALAAYLARK
ncbi:glycerol-3-phosphate dehydrogenase [Sphingorhabdus sp.]|jgi:glycerol-3-phosphate dehydrogenase|uniref:glycerol-3-phosphate dehydrogenase n=1 Tax=Sphingorhabdus sp. TaxID=1902408 RepID=UPI003BAF389E|nr:glycerol-3-phosphate dehydrogenase [Sphingomonadales bacterium]MBK9431264.1 glycerol-3-phosphate dehydrogenase [Sphingomonadales bacterium]